MALFIIENNEHLEQIKEKPFNLEKEIQELTEKNLKTIFGLELVRSEFSLNNFRVDTLAFDKESSSFVIININETKTLA
jgi:RecB family endonuclease NucS